MIRPAAISIVTVAVAAMPLAAQQPERHTLAGPRVGVYNLAGQVTIEPGDGPDVVVEVTRGGREAKRLGIVAREGRERRNLMINYPEDDIVYPPMGRGSTGGFTLDGRGGGWGEYTQGQRRRISIRGRGDGLEAWADLRIMVPAGRAVTIYLAVGEALVRNVDGEIAIDVGSADVRAEQTKGLLHVDTGSGNVEVNGATGTVSLETGSGDVTATGFSGTKFEAETGSGNIKVSAIAASTVEANTGSGDINMSRAKAASLELETGSGNIDLMLEADVEQLEVETGSGDVTLRMPDTVGGELRVDTGSGDIEVDFPITLIRRRESMLLATIGDGKGAIRVSTGSGNVLVRR